MNFKYILLFTIMFINWYGLYTQQPLISESVKPLVLALIFIYYLLETKTKYIGDILVLFGFFFSMWGDIFLIKSEEYFLFGLISFALAHISYIFLLFGSKKLSKPIKNESRGLQYFFIALLLVFLVLISVYLYPEAEKEDIGIPVVVYITLIVTMVIGSLIRKNYTSTSSFLYGGFGAITFTASDLILALGKFKGMHSVEQRVAVMVTYFISQFLIYQAFKKHNKVVDSIKKSKKN